MAIKLRVTKEVVFEAAHKLEKYVGPCANPHGHSYKLQICLEGTYDQLQENGLLVDFKDLKGAITENILSKWDHAWLNDLMTCNTTAENMVREIFNLMTPWAESKNVKIQAVRLWETANSFAELIND